MVVAILVLVIVFNIANIISIISNAISTVRGFAGGVVGLSSNWNWTNYFFPDTGHCSIHERSFGKKL